MTGHPRPYGRPRRARQQVLKLTHVLVRYGSLTQPVKRLARDAVVPALAGSPVIQRRAARRLSQVYITYPAGPLARPGRGRRRPGQRLPDIEVRAGNEATTLHRVLRGGRHALVVPAADLPGVLDDAGLRPYRTDLEVVTSAARKAGRLRHDGTGPVVLVRPDGHVAAWGSPGSMYPVTAYLRDLFRAPPVPAGAPAAGRPKLKPAEGSGGEVPGEEGQ